MFDDAWRRLRQTVTPKMSVRLLQVTLDSAERLGVDRAEVERRAELGDANLEDPDGRIPVTASIRLTTVLRDMLGPSAALRLGSALADERGTILSYVAENCRNLGEVYRVIERYRAIAFEVGRPKLTSDGIRARFGCVFPALFVNRAPEAVELFITFWLSKGRYLTGQNWKPEEIRLQSPPTDPETYVKVFGCPVINRAPTSEIVFDAAYVDLPVENADPNLLHFLKPIADEILERLPQREGVLQEVQSCIVDVLQDGDASLERVAAGLNMSTRTLQRRLESEGTSFATLLDDARRMAAFRYLGDPRISITETALLVGFSEPSTFYRAFKRWAGTTPAEYRRTHAA